MWISEILMNRSRWRSRWCMIAPWPKWGAHFHGVFASIAESKGHKLSLSDYVVINSLHFLKFLSRTVLDGCFLYTAVTHKAETKTCPSTCCMQTRLNEGRNSSTQNVFPFLAAYWWGTTLGHGLRGKKYRNGYRSPFIPILGGSTLLQQDYDNTLVIRAILICPDI